MALNGYGDRNADNLRRHEPDVLQTPCFDRFHTAPKGGYTEERCSYA